MRLKSINRPKSLDFMIIGAQKAGTTALASFLSEHSDLRMSRPKEVHLFDSPEYSSLWSVDEINARYRPCFLDGADSCLWGEATPICLYWPEIAPELRRYNPDLKLIVVLRDPVERAISHYMMEKGRGNERLPMGLAFLLERSRIRRGDPRSPTSARRVCSYLDRGHYDKQLRNLRMYFPDQQILVLENSELSQHHAATMSKVLCFLGVSPVVIAKPKKIFSGEYDKNAGSKYKLLLRYYFHRSNSRLKQLLTDMGVQTRAADPTDPEPHSGTRETAAPGAARTI